MFTRRALTILALVAIVAAPALATTWDSAANFATNGYNPYYNVGASEGRFTYAETGWDGGENFHWIGYDDNLYVQSAFGGLTAFSNGSDQAHGTKINLTGTTQNFTYQGTTYAIAPNQVFLVATGNPNWGAGMRWVAPADGTYSISAAFARPTYLSGANQYATDVHVIKNGVSLWDAALSTTTTSQSYTNNTLTLNKDDILIFNASHWYEFYGSSGTLYWNDATLANITISDAPVPEPGSMLALGSGLIGLMGFGIRRRK